MDDDKWLTHAVELARRSVGEGGGPFGAVIVGEDMIVATGTNRVTLDFDPSAHGEVVAIRAAGQQVGSHDLSGHVLYSSCEPCPMCLGAALWARLDRVVYAADREDAARAGFDDRSFHDLLAGRSSAWPTHIEHRRTPEARTPFDAWLQRPDRIDY